MTVTHVGSGVSLCGLWQLNNRIVTCFVGGLDCGEHPVIDGQVDVPWESDPDKMFTRRYITQLDAYIRANNINLGFLAVTIEGKYTIPAVVGFTYKSRGQRLRPMMPDDSGSQGGPAIAMPRRNDAYGAIVHNTRGVKLGTNFDEMNPAIFQTEGGRELSPTELFSGVIKDSIKDDYTYDGALAWETERPFPTNINAIGGFISTDTE
jgi:hypothetical protein